MWYIAVLYLAIRLIQLAVISVSQYIPLNAPFTFVKSYDSSWPFLFTAWANFDGVHYVNIARDGYVQFEQAFFPLFPLVLRLSFTRTPEYIVSFGLLLSSISFLIFIYTILTFFKETDGLQKKQYIWFVLFYLVFPTSFFLGALYTESFFLLLLSLYFLFGHRRQFFFAFLAGVLLGITRLNGLFAMFAMFYILALPQYKQEEKITKAEDRIKKSIEVTVRSCYAIGRSSDRIKILTVLAAPLLGFSIYALYLWQTTGDPLFFFHSQPAFGANRSTSLILLPQVYYRYIKILLTSNITFQYFISLIEFMIMSAIMVAVIYDAFITSHKGKQYQIRLGLAVFSFLNVVVPSLTGTLSSIPRYALICLTLFIVMAEVKNRYLKTALAILFSLLQMVLLACFARGYFVG